MRSNAGWWALGLLALLGLWVYVAGYWVPEYMHCIEVQGDMVLNVWQVPICINEGN